MTAERRDARLLFFVGLAFAAVSGAACAISFRILDEPLLADNPLAGVAGTCAVAGLRWVWAAVKELQASVAAMAAAHQLGRAGKRLPTAQLCPASGTGPPSLL